MAAAEEEQGAGGEVGADDRDEGEAGREEGKMADLSSGSSSEGEFTLRTTRSQLRERGPNDSHLL